MRASLAVAVVVSLTAATGSRAQAPAFQDPAVRSVGTGAETWLLLAGVVGGVGGFRALEGELLQRGHRVVTIDPFHFALDSADVTFSALARYMGTVLDRLDVHTVRVVGHSNGAGVALRMAAQMPERVSALYFLDAGALAANKGQVLSGSIRYVPVLMYIPFMRHVVRNKLVNGIRDNMGQREWFGQSKQHEYVDPMLDHIRRVVKLAIRLGEAKEPEALTETMARVRVPIVAILGDAPHASGPAADEFVALQVLGPRLRVIHLSGVGHFPHEEATSVVARYLLER